MANIIPDPRPLENRLHRISHRFISIDDEINTAFRHHFSNVSQLMITQLKSKDTLFQKIFQVLQMAGSYADGIKVNAPNEFDLLVLLKFPKPIPVNSTTPGYVTINIRDGLNTWLGWLAGDQEKYKRFIDGEGYLIQNQILDWLRKLVRGILAEHKYLFKIHGAEYSINQQNCGPAVTLDVYVQKCPSGYIGHFSIDFVPALQFDSNDRWVADKRPNIQVPRFWNAIPKPNKQVLHKNRDWICSYAEIERDYLNDLNRIKPLIRIFKKIRDKAHLTNLKSYYIKTIFLHRILEKSYDYWNRSLAVLFMEMFDVILNHLKTRTLWSLWHRNYNLFSQLHAHQIDAIYYNLKKIRDTITKNLVNNNPDIIYREILTREEMIDLEQREEEENQPSWCTIL
ncbi:cyclic GMP-AMP synthase-like [Bradysia coprophila]|uniref:cyclic GMP-AMP synthase-like n=1 Tax=Bradysia coprophila TaxID=38358 RepID=UPI00187D80DE|nr:cyclic GMP-AMP synthase-like [Bradysia coprophila]